MNLEIRKLMPSLIKYTKKIRDLLWTKSSLIIVILAIISYVSFVYITTDMDESQAAIITAQATKVQAVSAIMMLFVTIGLVYLSNLQTQTMKTQVNLSLHDKRYKIFTSLMIYINAVMSIPIPKQGENSNEFARQYENYLITYIQETRERDFLFDNSINAYIDSIDKRINKYFTVIVTDPVPTQKREYGQWIVKIDKEKSKLTPIFGEAIQTFKKYMSYNVL